MQPTFRLKYQLISAGSFVAKLNVTRTCSGIPLSLATEPRSSGLDLVRNSVGRNIITGQRLSWTLLDGHRYLQNSGLGDAPERKRKRLYTGQSKPLRNLQYLQRGLCQRLAWLFHGGLAEVQIGIVGEAGE